MLIDEIKNGESAILEFKLMPRKGIVLTAAFFLFGMNALECDARTDDVSLLDSLSDSCRLVRVGVVLGHELTSLCAPADRLGPFSHVIPPF